MLAQLVDIFGDFFASFRGAVVRNDGPRALFWVTAAVSLAGLWYVTLLRGTPPVFLGSGAEHWWAYSLAYWQSHVALGLGFVGVAILIEPFRLLESLLADVLPPTPRAAHERRWAVAITVARWLAFATALVLAIQVVPALHLTVPWWTRFVFVLAPMVGTTLAFYGFGIRREGATSIPRLSTYSFPEGALNFASAAPGCREVRAEIRAYESRFPTSALTHQRHKQFLSAGNESGLQWQGINGFFSRLTRVLNAQAMTPFSHENTTSAFAHILQHFVTIDSVVIYSDLDYESIRARTEITSRSAGARLAPISGLRERRNLGNLRDDDYRREIVARASEELNANSATRVIVVATHVESRTGLRLNVAALRRQLDSLPGGRERLLLLVDGAQAAGNVDISADDMSACDGYVTCGHKWLLCNSKIGVGFVSIDRWERVAKEDAATTFTATLVRAYAHPNYDAARFDPTNDLNATIGLNTALQEIEQVGVSKIADHNRALAVLFQQLVATVPLVQVVTPVPAECGIVAVRVGDSIRVKDQLRQHHGVDVESFDPDIIRISFHFCHSRSTVHRVVTALDAVIG